MCQGLSNRSCRRHDCFCGLRSRVGGACRARASICSRSWLPGALKARHTRAEATSLMLRVPGPLLVCMGAGLGAPQWRACAWGAIAAGANMSDSDISFEDFDDGGYGRRTSEYSAGGRGGARWGACHPGQQLLCCRGGAPCPASMTNPSRRPSLAGLRMRQQEQGHRCRIPNAGRYACTAMPGRVPTGNYWWP